MSNPSPITPEQAAKRLDRAVIRVSRMLIALSDDPDLMAQVEPHIAGNLLEDLAVQVQRFQGARRAAREAAS